jgi:hypothetical protein
MRILCRRLRQSRTHGIVHNVPHDVDGRFVVSDHSVGIALLPKSAPNIASVLPTGPLFSELHEFRKVGRARDAASKEMRVIWHEAVRKECDVMYRGRLLKLLNCACHYGGVGE